MEFIYALALLPIVWTRYAFVFGWNDDTDAPGRIAPGYELIDEVTGEIYVFHTWEAAQQTRVTIARERLSAFA